MPQKSDNFVYAIKDRKYISIDEFQSGVGKDCGCICPNCGETVCSNVTAKNPDELEKKFTNHFSHYNKKSKCNGGYLETELHLFAKELLKNSCFIMVPTERYHYPEKLKYNSVLLEPAFPLEEFKQYRPDVILVRADGEKIAVEIFVTNDLSDMKISLYRDKELKCLKIDLSKFYKVDLNTCREEIKTIVIEGKDCKQWIHPNCINELNKTSTVNQLSSNNDPSGCLLVFVSLVSITLFAIICFLANFI